MNAIFRSWIQNFGAAIKFLPENGAEIANAAFLEMCKPMNITGKVTAAEWAFSNGLVEQQNFIIIKMMDRTLEESQFSLDLALSWCLNAKNPLTNVHGFHLPTSPWAKPKATINIYWNNTWTNKILTDNLAALHTAREASVSCEHSEKIWCPLSNNTRTSPDTKYVSGDCVY